MSSGGQESQGGVAGKNGQFESNLPPQEQNLPGLERDMAPTSESTKLEGKDGFKEYKGVGKLKGKKVIITGGDSGIGRAVAAQMAREGADITIIYLKEEQPDADETKRIVEEAGQQCLCIPYNLEDLPGCEKVIKQHIDKFGTIDVLVNNASKQTECKDFSEIDLDIVKSTFQSNVLGMFALTKYALPHMKKGASIINTTSVTTFRGSANMVDYTSTKGAIVGFTRALAKNLLPKGIRVNAVAPGPVHTPLQPASRPAEEMEGFGSQSGIGRPGQPSEIAPTYVFLASAEATLYYGQVLHPYPLGD
ncbi:NAD(P)-binding protein [Ascobolus immersus RN42]|uniref:NAD(P)-binding protein n=1 Tax=Ascobolus immersus RN42 TaxID=1160509 RepID=A0A3N4IFP2_ASCIM|nr:NAD(P)-binding protein [Ascobolus immersus RN42]